MSYELCEMKHYIQYCAIYILFVFMNKCLFSYILYIKLSFFQKSTKVISGPIFIKFSPLKFKFNIVSYSNFEIILQFLNNSKLNSKFKFLCSNLT